MVPARRVERLGVARVGMAHDAHAGIGRQHALEPPRGVGVPSATTTMPAWSE